MTCASRASLLVDAEAYFRTFATAAERAVRTIFILGWDFDSRTPLRQPADSSMPAQLGDFLNFLVRRRRGLHVYILNWDYPMLFAMDRETRPIYGFNWKPARHVHLRYDNTQPVGASHHQKIVVIDDAMAFAGGLDLTSKRWDSCEHAAHDRRRQFEGKPYPPFHDIMVAVDAEAARALGGIARERWRNATGATLAAAGRSSVDPDPWPARLEPEFRDVPVAIARTLPATGTTVETREVEALFLDMIARATRYVYIENQYFTADRIGAALASRLAEPDAPEIVLVTRLLSHGWLEENTMHLLRTRLLKKMRDADHGGKFEAYYPHVPGLEDATCVDVHAKLMIVDDQWLRVGSANLSNRSMGLDTECDIVLEARGRADVAEGIVRVRDNLLAEHLGVSPATIHARIDAHASLQGAIRSLATADGRSLRVLASPEQPSGIILDLATVADPERPVSLDQLVAEFEPDTRAARKPAWIKLVAIAAVAAALALAWRFTPLHDLVTPDRVLETARQASDIAWVPLAIIAVYAVGGFVMFPRPLVTLFAVMAYGPVLGFVYAMAGVFAATLTAYGTGRALPRDTIRRLAGNKLNSVTQALRRRGLAAVFALSIVPTAPFVVIGIVAGAVRVRAWQYVLGSMLGHVPGVLTTAIFGDQVKTALDDPHKISYLLAAVAFVAFVVVSLLVRRWFRREGGAMEPVVAAHS